MISLTSNFIKNISLCKNFIVFKNDEVANVESDSCDVIKLDYVGFHDACLILDAPGFR